MSTYPPKPMENYNRLEEPTPGTVVVGMSNQYPSHSTQQLTMQEAPKPFAYDTLILNLITYFCCCPMCGFIGIVAALMSYSDHRSNDMVSHRSKRNVAMGCGIAGIVIGLLAIITAIALIVSAISTAEHGVSELQSRINEAQNNH